MSYSSGMLGKRVKVAKRAINTQETFGKSGQPKYEWVRKEGDHAFWCGVSFDKGMKSLREGALDSYATEMFRFRRHANMDEWCLLQYQGKWFQIQSFNEDYQDNTIQITAVRLANQKVTIVEPTPEPEPTPTPTPDPEPTPEPNDNEQ